MASLGGWDGRDLPSTTTHECESCGEKYRTRVEARACAILDKRATDDLPDLDRIFNHIGHDGPCGLPLHRPVDD